MLNWKEGAALFGETLFPSATIFIGAGLSKPCGLPDWDQLVQPYAEKMGLKTNDLSHARIMQYAFGNRSADYSLFRQKLKETISMVRPSHVHRLIARLHLARIWTTNYDSLLEDAYIEEGITPDIVAQDEDLYVVNYDKPQIVKIHGSLTEKRDTDIVLLESDYENYGRKYKAIIDLLNCDIRTKSVLYMGYGYDDPNIRLISSAIWNTTKHSRSNLLLTVPPPKKQIRKRKIFDLWEMDLQRYGVILVHLNSYDEITLFLYRLIQQVKGKTATIIGKYHNEDKKEICLRLGAKLAEQGFKIRSGGGPNVASFIAEGFWSVYGSSSGYNPDLVEYYYREHGGSTNPRKGRVIYKGKNYSEMRKALIAPENVCILIGEETETETETGIGEEVAIARNKGARIIPVAVTGTTAKRVWKEDLHYFSQDGCFQKLSSEYQTLNDAYASTEKLCNAIVALADSLMVRKYI